MNVRFVALFLSLAGAVLAQDKAAKNDAKLAAIQQFIDQAPRSSSEIDLEYAIKISEADRRKAIEMCDKAITKAEAMKSGNPFYFLSEKLLAGEGPDEAIASIPDSVKMSNIVRVILRANLLRFGGIFNGPKSLLTISKSQAPRARYVLAQAKRKWNLPITVIEERSDEKN